MQAASPEVVRSLARTALNWINKPKHLESGMSHSHAEPASGPEMSSARRSHQSSSRTGQQQGRSSGLSSSGRPTPEEGTVEGTNDEGSMETGPAVSMSHPNAAMLQSNTVKQADSSKSEQQPDPGKNEGEMEGTNDTGSAEVKPAASMSHPNAALLQTDRNTPGQNSTPPSQSQQVRRNDTSAADLPSSLLQDSSDNADAVASQGHPEQLHRTTTSAAGQPADTSNSGFDPSERVRDLIFCLKAFMAAAHLSF